MNTLNADKEIEAEAIVKTVVAWGSVSYAFGFLTVMLHTSRLGLPVLELLEPIYVWIGLPLAAFTFLARWLLKYFKSRSTELTDEFGSSLERLRGKLDSEKVDIIADLVGAINLLPFPRWILGRPLQRIIQRHMEPLLEQDKIEDPEIFERNVLWFSKITAIIKIFLVVSEFLILFARGALIIILLIFYVWELYPKIPQSFGGGKPNYIQLVVEKSALSPHLITNNNSPSSATIIVGSKFIILSADLLYQTKTYFFLKIGSSMIFAVKSAAVQSVIWNPSDPP